MMTRTEGGQADVKQHRKQNISLVCDTVDAIVDEQIWIESDAVTPTEEGLREAQGVKKRRFPVHQQPDRHQRERGVIGKHKWKAACINCGLVEPTSVPLIN